MTQREISTEEVLEILREEMEACSQFPGSLKIRIHSNIKKSLFLIRM